MPIMIAIITGSFVQITSCKPSCVDTMVFENPSILSYTLILVHQANIQHDFQGLDRFLAKILAHEKLNFSKVARSALRQTKEINL